MLAVPVPGTLMGYSTSMEESGRNHKCSPMDIMVVRHLSISLDQIYKRRRQILVMTLRVVFAMVLIFTNNCTVITLSHSQMTALTTSHNQASLYVASLVSLVSLVSPPRDHMHLKRL